MKLDITITVDEERISDLLATALEGGSTYWADIEYTLGDIKGGNYWSDAPMAGGHFIIVTRDREEINGAKEWLVDRDTCINGLLIMQRDYPRAFSNWLAENDDAETGDVFLQCVCFGEVYFG